MKRTPLSSIIGARFPLYNAEQTLAAAQGIAQGAIIISAQMGHARDIPKWPIEQAMARSFADGGHLIEGSEEAQNHAARFMEELHFQTRHWAAELGSVGMLKALRAMVIEPLQGGVVDLSTEDEPHIRVRTHFGAEIDVKWIFSESIDLSAAPKLPHGLDLWPDLRRFGWHVGAAESGEMHGPIPSPRVLEMVIMLCYQEALDNTPQH